MKIYSQNDIVKAALSEEKSIINSLTDFDLDDEQLRKVLIYKSLPQLDKDIIFLTSQHSVADVAQMYNVSRQYIYKLLNQINAKLL